MGETATSIGGGVCSQVATTCAGNPPPKSGPKTTMVAEVETEPNGSQRLLRLMCDVPVGGRPAVTAAMVRAQVQKLVPTPGIGIAPPGGISLVNIQTILWVQTAAERDLGTVTLVGQRVALRIHVQRVSWTFGDGTTAVTDSPGRPYSAAAPCRTATCAGYWGHVFRSTGPRTVSAQVSWAGEFRVGSGAWQSIAGVVTGPPRTTPITIREARGVLVPNEAHR